MSFVQSIQLSQVFLSDSHTLITYESKKILRKIWYFVTHLIRTKIENGSWCGSTGPKFIRLCSIRLWLWFGKIVQKLIDGDIINISYLLTSRKIKAWRRSCGESKRWFRGVTARWIPKWKCWRFLFFAFKILIKRNLATIAFMNLLVC